MDAVSTQHDDMVVVDPISQLVLYVVDLYNMQELQSPTHHPRRNHTFESITQLYGNLTNLDHLNDMMDDARLMERKAKQMNVSLPRSRPLSLSFGDIH